VSVKFRNCNENSAVKHICSFTVVLTEFFIYWNAKIYSHAG
jgi:hypothetical protein